MNFGIAGTANDGEIARTPSQQPLIVSVADENSVRAADLT
jgi:hypothetical protein